MKKMMIKFSDNVCELLDGAEIIATYDYTPFGDVTTNFTNNNLVNNHFAFSSEYHDVELGLIYYNYRHYNPTDGRWLSRDPIAEQGGMNLYNFVQNNATNIIDELGLGFNLYDFEDNYKLSKYFNDIYTLASYSDNICNLKKNIEHTFSFELLPNSVYQKKENKELGQAIMSINIPLSLDEEKKSALFNIYSNDSNVNFGKSSFYFVMLNYEYIFRNGCKSNITLMIWDNDIFRKPKISVEASVNQKIYNIDFFAKMKIGYLNLNKIDNIEANITAKYGAYNYNIYINNSSYYGVYVSKESNGHKIGVGINNRTGLEINYSKTIDSCNLEVGMGYSLKNKFSGSIFFELNYNY